MGIVTFPSLEIAIANGYSVYDRIPGGWLVRTKTERGWALAIARYSNRSASIGSRWAAFSEG
jgi:hypothetical protein